MSNPPLYAQDYVYSAQKVALATGAGLPGRFSVGQTGAILAEVIKRPGNPYGDIFSSDAEVEAFAAMHEVLAVKSPNEEAGYGADVLVLLDKSDNSIQFLVYVVTVTVH